MIKPKNRAELVRYLPDHPYLRFDHPGGMSAIKEPMVAPRQFIRMQANEFVFRNEKGDDTYLAAKASSLEFFEDRFEVIYGDQWGSMAGKRVVYTYLETPYEPAGQDSQAASA